MLTGYGKQPVGLVLSVQMVVVTIYHQLDDWIWYFQRDSTSSVVIYCSFLQEIID